MKVLNWKPGVDPDFDALEGTVDPEPEEKVQRCPRCGGKLLIRDNKVVDILEEESE